MADRIFSSDPNKNKDPYYLTAFEQSATVLWEKTPFAKEIPSLCYYRALTCFLEDEPDDLDDRRKLLFHYLSEFDKSDADAFIRKIYGKLPANNNLFVKLRRNLFSAYSEAPKRSFVKDNEGQNAEFEALYRRSMANVVIKNAYKAAGFTNTVAIRPIVRVKSSGKTVIEHQVLMPDTFRVITSDDDPFDVVEMWIPYQGKDKQYFEIWTPEQYRRCDLKKNPIEFLETQKFDSNGQPLPRRMVLEERNIYGRIPYEFMRIRMGGTFYGGGLATLVEAQLYSNKLRVLSDENVTYSALSIWLAINMPGKNWKLTPGSVVKADGVNSPEGGPQLPPSLENIAAEPFFESIGQHRRDHEKGELRTYGMSQTVLEDNPGTPQSGVAKLSEEQELNEERNEHLEYLKAFEHDYAELFALIINTDLKKNLPTTLDDFSVDFAEPRYYQTIEEEWAHDEARLLAGLMRPVHWVAKWSGDDSLEGDEDAINYILKNKESIARMKGVQTVTTQPEGIQNEPAAQATETKQG